MRSDMFEVIIERPRWDSGRVKGHRAKEHARRDPEHAPSRGSMSLSRGTKCLNENLAPLRRFLASRVGRPWNQVHAEVAANLAPRSAVQKHVLDHLHQYVSTDVVFIDGRPHEPLAEGSDRSHYRPIGRWGRAFYVCPKTGILRATPQVSRRKEPPRPDIRRLDDRDDARRIDGVWYRVTFAKLPIDYAARSACYDVVLRASPIGRLGSGRYGRLELEHGRARNDQYAIAIRPLTSRELRALGVANASPLNRSRRRPS